MFLLTEKVQQRTDEEINDRRLHLTARLLLIAQPGLPEVPGRTSKVPAL